MAMTIQLDLSGRVALVTGGARGVGRGITDRLVDAGATVVTCGRTEPPAGSLPTGASFITADVRDADAVDALVTEIVSRHGSLDIAVNNAGGSPAVPAADASPRFSEAIVRLNLLAALSVATRANAQMQAQDQGGVIVNISSRSGMRPTPATAAYGAAKAGLINLTETLAMEWAPKVRVVTVSAGMVRTEGFDDYYGGPEGVAAVCATVPMGRVAEPADVGNAVAFVVSPLAGFISGANLVVDGGGERLAFTEHLAGQ
jgi:NAD(P)-dependent dehydrogenase (short-subunit alcohol dehydrogenase family)